MTPELPDGPPDAEPPDDLDYWAWTIIANVSEGDWKKQTEDWRVAATRWRDAFHATWATPEPPDDPEVTHLLKVVRGLLADVAQLRTNQQRLSKRFEEFLYRLAANVRDSVR